MAPGHTHKELRKYVSNYYKQMDDAADANNADENSLLGKLKLQLLADTFDSEILTTMGTRKKRAREVVIDKTHAERICEDGVYASVADIIVLAIVLKRPITIYQKRVLWGKSNSMNTDDDVFNENTYEDCTVRQNEPIHLLFNGLNHFEAMILIGV